jgi:hypothetical protein
MGWSKLIDMELSDDEKLDAYLPMPMDKPDYPCGLRICLTDSELEKLGLEDDCDIGDMIDMRCFGTVTSVHKGDQGSRIEIQICAMSCENEMREDDQGE